MAVVKSVRGVTCTDAGRLASSCGNNFLMLFTTLIVLAPGCRWMFKMTAGVRFIHAA